jgi:hypothetical protein
MSVLAKPEHFPQELLRHGFLRRLRKVCTTRIIYGMCHDMVGFCDLLANRFVDCTVGRVNAREFASPR